MARIFIVEDSSDNMRLFQAVLRLQGHEIRGVADGTGLQEALESFAPHLVLMDIQLPGKDGYELLREIRALTAPVRTVRVIALTAHAMSGDEQKVLEAGFDGYITKPISVATFPSQIQEALGSA